MVSSGTVSGHSSELSQMADNYIRQIENLSSAWMGSSHDSIYNQCTQFYANMQKTVNQLNAFAEAVQLYEEYKEVKEKYQNNISIYNSQVKDSGNQSSINQFLRAISECESRMKELSAQIQSALERAGSHIMEAASTTTTEATVEIDKKSETDNLECGCFVADSSTGIYGHMVSGLDGTTHTIYNQTQIDGWKGDCNRAAASSIASGFANNNMQAVEIAKKSVDGIGYKEDVTNAYFSQFGLQASVNRVNGSYDTVKQDIITNLQQGNYVMFDLARPTVGQSGQRWTYKRHWLSVLDIKRTGDGPNDYAIFVSDSAHGGTSTDHGLGAGWYSIDEFTGKEIANLTTVSKLQSA